MVGNPTELLERLSLKKYPHCRCTDSEDNGGDSCEVVVPKLSKVLENINKVMTWLEQQTDSEHLHLLHLVNIN
jgi:hypothetical protein